MCHMPSPSDRPPGLTVTARRIVGRPMNQPPPLFSWDVIAPDESGVCGVTDDRERAFGHVGRELAALPSGACGLVREVELSLARPEYLDCGLIAVAQVTGQGVSWVR